MEKTFGNSNLKIHKYVMELCQAEDPILNGQLKT